MNNYVTAKLIKELREKNNMTQLDLANVLSVSDKTISKWETGKGLPDISLINPLATALKVSIIELMRGEYISNQNIISNMLKSNFYVCPICGNIIHSTEESIISCCGITLPKLGADAMDEKHKINCEKIENEYYDDIKSMLLNEKTYIKVRGFRIICKLSKWDKDNKINKDIDLLLSVLDDDKPTNVRQCLAVLNDLILNKKELLNRIEEKIKKIDYTKYKDTMSPLIKKDIDYILNRM